MINTSNNQFHTSEKNSLDKSDFGQIKWVWMDLDDTLIDFKYNSRSALLKLYQSEGLSEWFPTIENWIESYEKINKPLWEQYSRGEIMVEKLRFDRFFIPLADGGVPTEEAKDRAQRYDKLYLDLLAGERKTVDGAHDILVDFKNKGYKIGVLSNGFAEVQYRKIESAGLTSLIDVVVLSDDVGYAKPDPRIFRYAMEKVGEYDCNSHIMVGDNESTDIRGAIDSGWFAIYFSRDSGKKSMSVMTIGKLDDLRQIFDL